MTGFGESYSLSTGSGQQQNKLEDYLIPPCDNQIAHVSLFASIFCCCFYIVMIQVQTLNRSGSLSVLSMSAGSDCDSASCTSSISSCSDEKGELDPAQNGFPLQAATGSANLASEPQPSGRGELSYQPQTTRTHEDDHGSFASGNDQRHATGQASNCASHLGSRSSASGQAATGSANLASRLQPSGRGELSYLPQPTRTHEDDHGGFASGNDQRHATDQASNCTSPVGSCSSASGHAATGSANLASEPQPSGQDGLSLTGGSALHANSRRARRRRRRQSAPPSTHARPFCEPGGPRNRWPSYKIKGGNSINNRSVQTQYQKPLTITGHCFESFHSKSRSCRAKRKLAALRASSSASD